MKSPTSRSSGACPCPNVAVDPLRIDYEGAQPPAYTTRLAVNEHPGLLKQGQLAGTLELIVAGKVVASVPVAATKSVRAVPVWAWFAVPALLVAALAVAAVITGRRRRMSLRSRWSSQRKRR
jgi:hypothetical protein